MMDHPNTQPESFTRAEDELFDRVSRLLRNNHLSRDARLVGMNAFNGIIGLANLLDPAEALKVGRELEKLLASINKMNNHHDKLMKSPESQQRQEALKKEVRMLLEGDHVSATLDDWDETERALREREEMLLREMAEDHAKTLEKDAEALAVAAENDRELTQVLDAPDKQAAITSRPVRPFFNRQLATAHAPASTGSRPRPRALFRPR